MPQSVQARSPGTTYTDIVMCSIFTLTQCWRRVSQLNVQPANTPVLCLQDHLGLLSRVECIAKPPRVYTTWAASRSHLRAHGVQPHLRVGDEHSRKPQRPSRLTSLNPWGDDPSRARAFMFAMSPALNLRQVDCSSWCKAQPQGHPSTYIWMSLCGKHAVSDYLDAQTIACSEAHWWSTSQAGSFRYRQWHSDAGISSRNSVLTMHGSCREHPHRHQRTAAR